MLCHGQPPRKGRGTIAQFLGEIQNSPLLGGPPFSKNPPQDKFSLQKATKRRGGGAICILEPEIVLGVLHGKGETQKGG